MKLTESEREKNMKAKIEKAAFIKCLNLNSLVTKLLKQLLRHFSLSGRHFVGKMFHFV